MCSLFDEKSFFFSIMKYLNLTIIVAAHAPAVTGYFEKFNSSLENESLN